MDTFSNYYKFISPKQNQQKIKRKVKRNYQAIAIGYNNSCLCNFVLFDIDNESLANGFKQKKK